MTIRMRPGWAVGVPDWVQARVRQLSSQQHIVLGLYHVQNEDGEWMWLAQVLACGDGNCCYYSLSTAAAAEHGQRLTQDQLEAAAHDRRREACELLQHEKRCAWCLVDWRMMYHTLECVQPPTGCWRRQVTGARELCVCLVARWRVFAYLWAMNKAFPSHQTS